MPSHIIITIISIITVFCSKGVWLFRYLICFNLDMTFKEGGFSCCVLTHFILIHHLMVGHYRILLLCLQGFTSVKKSRFLRVQLTCWWDQMFKSTWVSPTQSRTITRFSGTSAQQETPPWSWSAMFLINLSPLNQHLKTTLLWLETDRKRLISTSWARDTLKTVANIMELQVSTVVKKETLSYKNPESNTPHQVHTDRKQVETCDRISTVSLGDWRPSQEPPV